MQIFLSLSSAVTPSYQSAFDPTSLEQCSRYALQNPTARMVLSEKLKNELATFYGLDSSIIEQDPLKGMTGKEYVEMLGQISQRVTWEQLQKVRLAGESSYRTLHRLRSVPGLDPSTVLYDTIAKTVIGSTGSRTPWAILRYHEEYKKLTMCAHTPDPHSPEETAGLFAPQEMLAKIIAYAQPEMIQPGMIVPLWHSGQTVYYQIADQLHESGLHAYFLTPIDNPEAPAQMLFRGTRGLESAYRDLDPTGIGKTVFDQCASRLVDIWKSYAKNHPKCSLHISGHSLGALDSQRMLVALSQDEEAIQDHSFQGFFFCSPKLDQSTWDQWKPIHNCDLNFAQHNDDLFTQLGCGNINVVGHTRYYIASSPSSTNLNLKDLHTRPLFPEGKQHPDNLPCNHISHPPPDAWRSSQVLQPDSQTSFQVFGENAPRILQEWRDWLGTEDRIAHLSAGRLDWSKWVPWKT